MAKRPSGCKLLPNAEKGIFVGYTKTDHQYRIFVPARKQIVISADVKFIPYEGDQPVADLTSILSPHKIHQQTPITSSILLNNWKNSSNVGEGQNIQDLSHNQDPSYLSQSEPSQESSVPTYIQLKPQPSASNAIFQSSQFADALAPLYVLGSDTSMTFKSTNSCPSSPLLLPFELCNAG